MCRSDVQKRQEIFLEVMYYLFDSIVMPLIRFNFHVTESNAHQNHLFYFRHDVWRQLTEPAIAQLKVAGLANVETSEAQRLLSSRQLGFSQIRFLPKMNGLRPIANLRRRITQLQHGRAVLGRSVNSVMAPVFQVLDFEKRKRPELVGSSLFSPGEMFTKLHAFAKEFKNRERPTLYFAKADVKSCFDTIPQGQLLGLVKKIVTEQEYTVARHCEVKFNPRQYYRKEVISSVERKPARKFRALARSATDFPDFSEAMSIAAATGKKRTIFVDNIAHQSFEVEPILNLLEQHIKANIIKIGKKFYRQKKGIPQGSVLSTLLCNYFYADLERDHLSFLQPQESLFMRLIDDFLLITTNKEHAVRFLRTLHGGIVSHGVEINPTKSLANFEVNINGSCIPQHPEGSAFPYCGNAIDTKTLEITRDRNRRKDSSWSLDLVTNMCPRLT